MSDYARSEVLVETDWLEDHLDDPNVAIVEVDEDVDAYEKGHSPNAISIDWESELQDLPRREFISSERLASLLGQSWAGSAYTMVLYSGNKSWFAAYA